jgi:hypothetical protein
LVCGIKRSKERRADVDPSKEEVPSILFLPVDILTQLVNIRRRFVDKTREEER